MGHRERDNGERAVHQSEEITRNWLQTEPGGVPSTERPEPNGTVPYRFGTTSLGERLRLDQAACRRPLQVRPERADGLGDLAFGARLIARHLAVAVAVAASMPCALEDARAANPPAKLVHKPIKHAFSSWAPDMPARTIGRWTVVDGQWQVGDSRLEQTGYCEQGVFAFTNARVLADSALSARFKVTPLRSGAGAVDFVFRAQSSSEYYFARFDTAVGSVSLWAARRELTYPLAEVGRPSSPIPIAPGQWHRARVEAVGPSIKVELDGKTILETKANVFAAGTVGFCVEQGHAVFDEITVEGADGELPKPWFHSPPEPILVERAVAPWEKTIVENAGAGGYEAYPDICKLANGDLYCVFTAGYYHVSAPSPRLPRGARLCYARSSDNAETWSSPKLLIDTLRNEQDGMVTQLADGTLLCLIYDYYGADAGSLFITESKDNGETWSKEWPVAKRPGFEQMFSSEPILRLPDDTLLMAVYGFDHGEEVDGRPRYRSGILFSYDHGRTWPTASIVGPYDPEPRHGRSGVCEIALTRLRDGKLIAHTRSSMYQSESTDDGRSWSALHKTVPSLNGYCPNLLYTSNGMLISAHRWPNTSLNYSADDGEKWSDYVMVSECWGAQPSMVELEDGSVLMVYYEENSGSDIRAARFRVTDTGVVFIPWAK